QTHECVEHIRNRLLMFNPLSISWWRTISKKLGSVFGWGFAIVIGLPLVIYFGNNLSSRGSQSNAHAAADNVIMTVNGEPVTQRQINLLKFLSNFREGTPGAGYAGSQGQLLSRMITC